MEISIIAALSDDFIIGNNNKLPWHLPADLQHFKAITLGKPVIMGRKTYESIGKALPGRKNIIITHDKNWRAENCEIYHNVKDILNDLKNYPEIMIIGGAEIYKQFLPLATKMYLTVIHHDFIGDKYFPKWDSNEWQEISREYHPADEKNAYDYSFVLFKRIRHI